MVKHDHSKVLCYLPDKGMFSFLRVFVKQHAWYTMQEETVKMRISINSVFASVTAIYFSGLRWPMQMVEPHINDLKKTLEENRPPFLYNLTVGEFVVGKVRKNDELR